MRLLVCLGCVLAAGTAGSQSGDSFSARLGWVPISLSEQNLVAGGGRATATLSRSELRIEGNYSGLRSPATAARLHQGTAPGARGPAIADLEITGGSSGDIAGGVELDRRQREALLAGHLYIQVHAESGVPPDDAVLRGWLFAFEEDAR